MKAQLMMRLRRLLTEDSYAEIVIWQLPRALPGSVHEYKYRLAYVVKEVCVLRYDNESGKGDHKHVNEREMPYAFTSTRHLVEDFWRDVEEWSDG